MGHCVLKQTPCNKFMASSCGRVFKILSQGKIKELLYSTTKKGYVCVPRSSGHNYLHRLIASLFLPTYSNELQVNHLDGIKTNNSVCNLEMCTNSENMKHAINRGLVNNKGIRNGMSKLTEDQALNIKYNSIWTNKELALMYGVDTSVVSRIRAGKSWRYL